MKKRFSIRYKLILIFGILIAAAGITEGLLATKIARTAVSEKIEAHLTDKEKLPTMMYCAMPPLPIWMEIYIPSTVEKSQRATGIGCKPVCRENLL